MRPSQYELQDLLKVKAGLVTASGLRETMRKRVLSEAKPI